MNDAPRAYARTTDPAESHAAARGLDEGTLNDNRAAVLDVLRAQSEPVTDRQLCIIYDAEAQLGRVPFQTDSGIRTRRNELARGGLVVRTGALTEKLARRTTYHSLWAVAA